MNILLIDLNSILYPIWHMSGSEPDVDFTSRSTVAKVRSLATAYEHVAICCDTRRSVRKETISADYKANRTETDERIIHQLRLVQETLAKDGFPVWSVDGYEADDVIASAVTQASKLDPAPQVVIASSDKDLLQLVTEHVSVLSIKSGALLGPQDVAAKFVRPQQMRDYLVLVGDTSDNVKGVPGIGDKRAKELLKRHGSLLAIYEKLAAGTAALEGLTPAMATALQESIHIVETGRKLVSLFDNLPIPFDDVLKPRVQLPLANIPGNDFDEDDQETEDHENMESTNQETGEVMEVSNGNSSKAQAAEIVTRPPETPQSPEVTPAADTALVAPVSWDLALEPRNPGQAVALAVKLFNSRMFAGYGNPEAVLSTILLGRELGVGAMGSLRGIHNVKGRHALSADLMAALVLKSGKAMFFGPAFLSKERATYRTQRVGTDKPFELTFEFEEARVAGLIKDDSGWTKWPLDMCKARCIARLARAIYPDVCFGLYVTEEIDSLPERVAA